MLNFGKNLCMSITFVQECLLRQQRKALNSSVVYLFCWEKLCTYIHNVYSDNIIDTAYIAPYYRSFQFNCCTYGNSYHSLPQIISQSVEYLYLFGKGKFVYVYTSSLVTYDNHALFKHNSNFAQTSIIIDFFIKYIVDKGS